MSRTGPPRMRETIVLLAAGFGFAAAVLGLRGLGWLNRVELLAFDLTVRAATPARAPDPRIAILEVSEADIQALGTWPLSDGVLADVIVRLEAAGARTVGVDIYRDIPVPPGSERLDEVLRTRPLSVFPTKYADRDALGVPPPAVLAGTLRAAFNNVVMDVDGIVRRGLLFMDDGRGGVGYAFPLVLAMLYLGHEGVHAQPDPERPELMRLGAVTFAPLQPDSGGYSGMDAGGYQYLLDFPRVASDLPAVGLGDLLAGRADPAQLSDRVVIVGLTAESVPDLFHVAFDWDDSGSMSIPGAHLHGYMTSQLIRSALGEIRPLRLTEAWQETAAVLLLSLLGAVGGLYTYSTRRFVLAFASLAAAAGLLGLVGVRAGWWIPVVPPSLACLASLVSVTAWVSSRTRAERSQLLELFSSHVSQAVAEEVWEHREDFLTGGRPVPKRLTASVLFVDMKGYSGAAAKLDPAELMEWMNAYLERLSGDVFDSGGLVEDYFGDGIMAAFGVPIPRSDEAQMRQDAVDAVSCARAMRRSVDALNAEWCRRGYPRIFTRIGISSGDVVVGTMGSERRLKYSIVGEVVVQAQRLESLDDSDHDFEQEPCRILIAQKTRELLGTQVSGIVDIGSRALKGGREPVPVYRVRAAG